MPRVPAAGDAPVSCGDIVLTIAAPLCVLGRQNGAGCVRAGNSGPAGAGQARAYRSLPALLIISDTMITEHQMNVPLATVIAAARGHGARRVAVWAAQRAGALEY